MGQWKDTIYADLGNYRGLPVCIKICFGCNIGEIPYLPSTNLNIIRILPSVKWWPIWEGKCPKRFSKNLNYHITRHHAWKLHIAKDAKQHWLGVKNLRISPGYPTLNPSRHQPMWYSPWYPDHWFAHKWELEVRIGKCWNSVRFDLLPNAVMGGRGVIFIFPESGLGFRVIEGARFTPALYPPRIKGNTHFGCSHFFLFSSLSTCPPSPLACWLLLITRYFFVVNLLAHFCHLLLLVHSLLLIAHSFLLLAIICSLAFTTCCCYCFDVCYYYFAIWFHHLLLFCCLLSPLVVPIVIDPFKKILIFWLWNLIYQCSL